MYNSPYNPIYSTQNNIDRINTQINELESMKTQLQQQKTQPTNLTQNFQLAPQNRDVIRYAASIDEVQRDMVIGDTPYFSKDMSVVWIKNTKGEIKTYELNEIVPKDEKDIQIELLQAQIDELKKGMISNEQPTADDDEPETTTDTTAINRPIRATAKKSESRSVSRVPKSKAE